MYRQETEKIIAELNETWEEKLRKTEALRMERCERLGWQCRPWEGAWGGLLGLAWREVNVGSDPKKSDIASCLPTERRCWLRWG